MHMRKIQEILICRCCAVLTAILICGGLLAPAVAAAPLTGSAPMGENTVRLFFNLINEQRIFDAVQMLDGQLVPDHAAAQAWAANFNTIAAVRVTRLQPWERAGWSDDGQKYKVFLHIERKSHAPYYGWEDGLNIRWLTIQCQGSLWKIREIATGP